MIIRTPAGDLRVRAMYPGEGIRPGKPDAAAWYFLQAPCEIAIDAATPAADQAEYLIHEIIHSIYHERKMPKRAAEETVCVNLSAGLAIIIRDNPEIVAALGLALTEGVPII